MNTILLVAGAFTLGFFVCFGFLWLWAHGAMGED